MHYSLLNKTTGRLKLFRNLSHGRLIELELIGVMDGFLRALHPRAVLLFSNCMSNDA